MKFEIVKNVDLPVSQIVMGTLFAQELDRAAPVFDEYVAQGGNTFDTAHHYGNAESVFGEWLCANGERSETVIITKGAHTPNCYPEAVTEQLFESLDRLNTDFVDIYFLHRDNPDVPVGEFLDVLTEHNEAGRIRAFGGSNWSLERVDEANAYATREGKAGFTVLSNHTSLARMIEPPWSGCLAVSDAESKRWLNDNQMPLFPWSSQARGFFVEGRSHPDDESDPELVRCWYSDDNFERLERVESLAKKLGVKNITVALAYLLNQPTPTFPIVGPVNVEETRSSLAALNIELTDADVRWLNLED